MKKKSRSSQPNKRPQNAPPRGKVTSALSRARKGAPLEEIVYLYLFECLQPLWRSKKRTKSGDEPEDRVQNVMVMATNVAKNKRYDDRKSFLYACLRAVLNQHIDQLRRELGRNGELTRVWLSPDALANIEDNNGDWNALELEAHKERCREMRDMIEARLACLSHLERKVVERSMETSDRAGKLHRFSQEYATASGLPDDELFSERHVSRLLHDFPRQVIGDFFRAHGMPGTPEQIEKCFEKKKTKRRKSR